MESETDVDHDRTDFLFFKYSTINPVDIHRRPSWVGGRQLLPDFLWNGLQTAMIRFLPKNVQPWGTPPTRSNFMGGDLPALFSTWITCKSWGLRRFT